MNRTPRSASLRASRQFDANDPSPGVAPYRSSVSFDSFDTSINSGTDRATWALLTDLKRRGLWDDTLVIWGGEFGRTPMFQGKGGPGRDHHIKGFSMWLAGGPVRGGVGFGATDELGYNAVENVVHVRDLHATVLHLLGIDHERFTVKYQGLDMRLTGVERARAVKDILI